jgi:hypothetical protein
MPSDGVRLFDRLPGSEQPYRHSEPCYEYLARCSSIEARRIRDLLETWFEDYPTELKPDLRARFRSRRDDQHRAAAFEFYLFALLTSLGYDVVVEPKIGTKRPDFLAINLPPIYPTA